MIRTSTLFLLAALPAGLMAQQQLSQSSNTPIIGTTFAVYGTDLVNPGAAGAPVTWDFSALPTTGADVIEIVDPATSEHAALFPTATYAMVMANGDTLFYKDSPTGLELVGEDATYATFPVQCPLTDGQLNLKFPCSYGTMWSDPLAANYTIDGNSTVRTGTITGMCDGSGTLITPTGTTEEVLRVHTRLQQTDVIGIFNATHNRDEWSYYAVWMPLPLVRITSDTITITALGIQQVTRTTEWFNGTVAGVEGQTADAFGLNAYPVPANDAVTLTFGSFGEAMELNVIDAQGRLVSTERLGTLPLGFNTHTVNSSAWPAGIYQVRITSASGAQSTQRLVKE